MVRFIFSTFLIGLCAFVFSGCSKKSETSQFTIQLPKASSKAVDFSSFSDGDVEDPWLGSITSADEINCYIVFAGAPEPQMSRHYCLDRASNQTLTKFGVYKGGVPAGGTVSIDVPAGKNRNILLLGAHALDGACTDFSNQGPQKNRITHPRILVSQTVDLEPGTNRSLEMNIPQDLSGLSEVGGCFIDEPWGDINDQPSPEVQLDISDLTGGKDSMNITGGVSPGTANVFQITNNGTIDSTSLTGAVGLTNSTYFSILGNTCNGVLSPGQSCTVTIEPIAATNTSYTGVLSLSVDNFPSVTLTGSASGFAGPTATIASGQPLANDNSAELNIQVGGTDVAFYRYKVGLAASIDCSTAAGYSAEIAVGTPITDSPADGNLEICIIGRDVGMNWQLEAAATSFTWLKDTVAPSVVVTSPDDPGPTPDFPIATTITFSEDVTGFNIGNLAATNASLTNFTAVNAFQYTVELIPFTPNTSVQLNVASAQVNDLAGNSNMASNTWTILYQPDVTLDPISWVDFYNTSSMETVSGLDVPVDLEFSSTYEAGAPSVEYSLNGGGWSAFVPGSPAIESVFNGDLIQFRVSGGVGDIMNITLTNITDGNIVIDNVVGTVEDPCELSPSIGTVCSGGSLYAGNISSTHYMVTPGGCTDSASPVCSGSDTTFRAWNGSAGSANDVTSVIDVANATSPDPTEGDTHTANLVLDPSIDVDSAADYCNDMIFGGYSDWYLPSKTELAYLYCKANVPSHDMLYPNEDPDCGAFGGKTSELSGFAAGAGYWSSSEGNSVTGWRVSFVNGLQSLAAKANAYNVRCLRKKL